MNQLTQITTRALESITEAKDHAALDKARVQYLGKKGELTDLLKGLKDLPAERRPIEGAKINDAKKSLQDAITTQKAALDRESIDAKLLSETIDVTLPGRGEENGGLHPITQVIERIEFFFQSVGYEVVEGPEIEDDYHNFEALNLPPHLLL